MKNVESDIKSYRRSCATISYGVPLPSVAIVGLGCGAVAGWGVSLLGWPMILAAAVYGVMCGEVILRAVGRKRSAFSTIWGIFSILIGVVVGRLTVAALVMNSLRIKPPLGMFDVIVDLVSPSPLPLVTLFIAIFSTTLWIRYSTKHH